MVELYLANLIKNGNGVTVGEKSYITIKVSGHAGFGGESGDIVCAAISAIIQTAIVSITRVAGIRQDIKQDHGYLESVIEIKELNNNKLNDLLIIINTMLAGLDEVKKIHQEVLSVQF